MEAFKNSEFDSHVQNQLQQMSLQARSQNPQQAFGVQHHNAETRSHHPQNPTRPVSGSYSAQTAASSIQSGPRSGVELFPRLGAAQSMPSAQQGSSFPQTEPYSSSDSYNRQDAPKYVQSYTHHNRGRGRGRGRGQTEVFPFAYRQASHGPAMHTSGAPDYQRARGARNGRLYHPSQQQFHTSHEQSRAQKEHAIEQCDYLNCMAEISLKNILSEEEINWKYAFCKKLEALAHEVIFRAKTIDDSQVAETVKLEAYGSLVNGFGTAGCDMDLMLTSTSADGSYESIDEDIKRDLERAVLNEGFGARLLTNTRIPILRVCSKPSTELLEDLREHRLSWEKSLQPKVKDVKDGNRFGDPPKLTSEQEALAAKALNDLDESAVNIALPPSPPPENAKLEFTGDCGIQCDINFTNHIALINSTLLRAYAQFDQRVRLMGIFVKNWAKARDINTPYKGTLSSYGFVMMVLHYLMNIARPPVIPNLQQLAKDGNGWTEPPLQLFEGHDVRFLRDNVVAQQHLLSHYKRRNNQTLGGLLREFFMYYATPAGFNWMRDVISIRSPGGLVNKAAKGWTEAKWAESKTNVRLRYLVAIEDPFELTHNIGRTVGHSGIIAIREEFRRAWKIIGNIQQGSQPGQWLWAGHEQPDSGSGTDLLAKAEVRGDLLKRDKDERKQKLRKLREETEAKETKMKSQGLDDTSHVEAMSMTGMCKGESSQCGSPLPFRDKLNLRLIRAHQQQNKESAHARRMKLVTTWLASGANCSKFVTKSAYGEDQQNVLKSSELRPKILMKRDVHVQSCGHVGARKSSPSTKNYSESHKSPLVGEFIGWSTTSVAGRWLSARDDCIRKGKWRPPNASDKVALNARFPYNPSMTIKDLSIKNEHLDKYFRNSFYPRMETRSNADGDRIAGEDTCHEFQFADHTSKMTRRVVSLRREHTSNDQALASEDCEHHGDPFGVEPAYESFSDEATVKTQTSPSEPNSNSQCVHGSEVALENGAADVGYTARPFKSPSNRHRDQSITLRTDVENNILNFPTCSWPIQVSQDTQVMPIPHQPNFEFDIRQMADLKVIEAGGNGCALCGHEWTVEPMRSSWGGGGAMAEKI